jgi:hypothetical protein
MSNHTGVDELDPMEAIQEDVDSAHTPADADGWSHIGHHSDPEHPHPDCGAPSYQGVEGGWGGSPREIDSEDGPPPRRGGPTT